MRTKVLRGKPKIDGRPGKDLKPLDFNALKSNLEEKHGRKLRDVDIMSAAMFPKEFDEFEQFRQNYGPVDKLNTKVFLKGLDIAEETDVSFFYKNVETIFIKIKLFYFFKHVKHLMENHKQNLPKII